MRPRLTVLLGATLAVLLAVPPAGRATPELSASQQRPTDYAIVAHQLAVFCRYITWPESPAGTPAEAPLCIGVLGPNPFGQTLEQVLAGKALRGHPFSAVYATDIAQLAGCPVVFINYTDADRIADALATLAGKPVLTALYRGDTTDAPATGAAIELVRIRNNVRYLLNPAALAAQGLQPTPGLLENALRRIGGPTP